MYEQLRNESYRQSQWGGWSNQKLSTNNIVQRSGSVLEGFKNYNVFEKTRQLVQERALDLRKLQ